MWNIVWNQNIRQGPVDSKSLAEMLLHKNSLQFLSELPTHKHPVCKLAYVYLIITHLLHAPKKLQWNLLLWSQRIWLGRHPKYLRSRDFTTCLVEGSQYFYLSAVTVAVKVRVVYMVCNIGCDRVLLGKDAWKLGLGIKMNIMNPPITANMFRKSFSWRIKGMCHLALLLNFNSKNSLWWIHK